MAPSLSPTVWSRWLALELRHLREQADLSQKEVAKALRCNVSKVSYFENGQRPVVPRDLDEVLLPLYSVPQEEWGRYLAAARDARAPRWWEAYTEAEITRASGELYLGLEQGASRLRIYQPQLVPGLLQTADYTRAILNRTSEWNDEKTDLAIELRLRRQGILHGESDPLKLWAILDEAAIRRMVGGGETMGSQLSQLVELASLPNITIQLLPFSIGAHHAMHNGFVMLEFDWPQAVDRGVVYLETNSPAAGSYVDARHEVAMYISTFEQLSALALSPDSTVSTLKEITKENNP